MTGRSQLYNDAEEAMRLTLDGRQSMMWTAIPGIVQSVNFTAMTCEVQPSIKGSVEDEKGAIQSVDLPLLVDVPIIFPSGGGFLLTTPLAANNEVLVVFSSRCIDAWWQSGGIQKPMEARMHDLSDGFAIPGPFSQPKALPLGTVNTTDAQLRNNAGTSVVGITAAGLIDLHNAAKDMKGVLNGMLDLLNTLNTNLSAFATTSATDPVAVVVAGAAAALVPQLATLIGQVTAYKTTSVGLLLK